MKKITKKKIKIIATHVLKTALKIGLAVAIATPLSPISQAVLAALAVANLIATSCKDTPQTDKQTINAATKLIMGIVNIGAFNFGKAKNDKRINS